MGKQEAIAFVTALGGISIPQEIMGVLCPSFPLLGALHLPPTIALGAQNCSSFGSGPYTGEVSASLLQEMGCAYVIVGHSERRTLLGETSLMVKEKACQVLDHGMTPILCIGEPLDIYDQGRTDVYLKEQLEESLPDRDFILAYEPVWSIGTGHTPRLEEIEAVHKFLHNVLKEKGFAHTPILYGGSVTGKNAREILVLPSVSGVLVGGASVSFDMFLTIIESAT